TAIVGSPLTSAIELGRSPSESARQVAPASNVTSGPRRSVSTTPRHPSANASDPYEPAGGRGASDIGSPERGSKAWSSVDDTRTEMRSNPGTTDSAMYGSEVMGSSLPSQLAARQTWVLPALIAWKTNPPPSREGSGNERIDPWGRSSRARSSEPSSRDTT